MRPSALEEIAAREFALRIDRHEVSRLDLAANQFVEEFVSSILGQRIDCEQLSTEERTIIFHSLSRFAEVAKERRKGERLVWKLEDVEEPARADLAVPHLDYLVQSIGSRLLPAPIPAPPMWPANHRWAVCLTHDMDHVTSFRGTERRRALKRYINSQGPLLPELFVRTKAAARSTIGDCIRRFHGARDHFDNVGHWLRLEAEFGFKSSLFFFAETIQPWHRDDCNYTFSDRVQFEGYPTTLGAMMREVAARGWDVGIHGSICSATEPGVLNSQKVELEGRLNRPVLTTRMHFLQYDPIRTPANQASAGLLADGSQGFHNTVGFRAATSFPYRMWDWTTRTVLPLWQIPLHIQDGPLFLRCTTSEAALRLCCRLMDEVQAVGGCLGLLLHPAKLATDSGLSIYHEILCEARRRGAWGCSMKEAAEWWQARCHAVFTSSKSYLRTALR
jgi:hypothetical protein